MKFPHLLRIDAILIALLSLLLLSGCGGKSDKKLRIAVVPKGTNHLFWKTIHAGAIKAAEEATGKHRASQQRAVITEAMSAHEFVARDVVETYVGRSLVWEGDELMFKTDSGSLVSVKDGVAGIAKARPELLKPAGAGGAGVRQPAAGSGGAKHMTRAEFEALEPAQRVEMAKAGVQLT